VTESISEQIGDVFLEEGLIRRARLLRRRIEQRRGNLTSLDQVDKTSEQDMLGLEARLVVGVGNDVEYVAEEVEEVLLVELIRNIWRRIGKVVDDVERDWAISFHLCYPSLCAPSSVTYCQDRYRQCPASYA
jgi:hypothetical protein